MRPSKALDGHKEDIRRIVEMNDARNPRIFGSALHGDDVDGSDLDLLVEPISGRTTLISLLRIQRQLTELLGVPVDVQTPGSISARFRQRVLDEAASL